MRIYSLTMLAAFAIAVCMPAHAADLKLPLLWTADLATFLESGPSVADINGDGRDEVLAAGREEMIALDGKGKELWRWQTPRRFMTYPAVLERQGRPALIYAADTSGQLTCLDGGGKEVWRAQLNGPCSWSAAVVRDINGDGAPEVIQTDESGAVWAFNALTGAVLWQASVKGMPVSPAVGDLDGDGKSEIVAATSAGELAAISCDGKLLWSRVIGGSSETWATSAPIIFAASDGRARIAAAANEGRLSCLDAQGNTVWERPLRGTVASTLSAGDIDLDGRADIFLVTQVGVIYRFDEGGQVLWDIDMQSRCLAAGAILDINGDGRLEYALCTQAGHLMVLNDAGESIFEYRFNNRTINVTPAFGDVVSDSPGLEMIITGGEAGQLFCFGTHAPKNALTQWAAYRGDEQKTGAWTGLTHAEGISMAPQNLAWDQVFTGEDIRFVVHNPRPDAKPLKATAVCLRPDGARQEAATSVLGKRGELLMPVEVLAPGIYHFTWSLTSAEGRELFSGKRQVSLRPFANDRAVNERAIAALINAAQEVEKTLPLSTRALRREAQALGAAAKDLAPRQDAAAGDSAMAGREVLENTASLVARAKRGLRMAEVIRQAVPLGPGTSLLAFEGTLWENRRVDEQLPARAANPLRVQRRAVPGEHEAVAVNLFNVTDRELLVRVLIEAPAGGPTVTPHRSVAVPTALGEVAWDALPRLDEASLVSIPPLTSREVWLDADAGPASPGRHSVTLRCLALNGAGVLDAPTNPHEVPAPETVVDLSLNVLPFQMAPPGAFRLCTWAASEGPQVEDLLAHGNNVFLTALPEPVYSQEGGLTGLDATKLDAVLERFRGHDVMFLLQGLPALRGETGGPEYRADLKNYLEKLVGHLAAMGIDANHFALYPLDEPGGHGWHAVNQVVEFGKMVKAANPAVMIYVNGGGELPMFQALAPITDIWCPGIYMLAEDTTVMNVVRGSGKMLWSYNCGYGYARPTGPNLKNINIVAEYRAAAPFAFRHNSTGIGYWCYNTGGDPWTRVQMEYMLVYPGRDKPVTSRRWEAVREGIEDFRILAALKARLNAAQGAPLSTEARTRIQHLIEVSLPGMLDQSFKELTLALGRNVIDASNNDATVAVFREEMLDCAELAGAGN